jgi:hypothetical protein
MLQRTPLAISSDSLPLLAYLVGITALCLAFASFLHWLMQPVVLSNPGLAAYRPPPATRIEPLVRKSDAPELTLVPDASEIGAEIKETAADPGSELREPRKAARVTKSRKIERREARFNRRAGGIAGGRGQPAYAYVQGWNSWARRPTGSWNYW